MVTRLLHKSNYLTELGFSYPKDFLTEYEEVLNDVLPMYILKERKIPLFFRPHDLAKFLKIELSALIELASIRDTINQSENLYRTFKIPKKSGGYRKILAPKNPLKTIQKKIYEGVLIKIHPSDYSMGFRPEYSIVSNATVHLNSKTIHNVDLKDFFPSIKFVRVLKVFKNIGYSGAISFLLSRLCAYTPRIRINSGTKLVINKNEPAFLPQGAPTSPAISNLVCLDLDYELSKIAKLFGFKYSRYADDMTFSCAGNRTIPMFFRYYMNECINRYGFKVNNKKERFSRNRTFYRRVTGVNVHENELTLPRKFMRNLRAALHQLKHFNADTHNPLLLGMIKNVQGRIAYATMVNKAKYYHFFEELQNLKKSRFKNLFQDK